MKEQRVICACPNVGSFCDGFVFGTVLNASRRAPISFCNSKSSALVHNFNSAWCFALNSREKAKWTHFAMAHSDVVAGANWIDELIDILEETGADVAFTTIPIKSAEGRTSCGLMDTRKRQFRRLTMIEAMQLPPTFWAEDLQKSWNLQWPLICNTGLWVARFDRPWIEKVVSGAAGEILATEPDPLTFDTGAWIHRTEDGVYIPHFEPEDWRFSLWLARHKIPYVTTRKVHAIHVGECGYTNNQRWGTLAHDTPDQFNV